MRPRLDDDSDKLRRDLESETRRGPLGCDRYRREQATEARALYAREIQAETRLAKSRAEGENRSFGANARRGGAAQPEAPTSYGASNALKVRYSSPSASFTQSPWAQWEQK